MHPKKFLQCVLSQIVDPTVKDSLIHPCIACSRGAGVYAVACYGLLVYLKGVSHFLVVKQTGNFYLSTIKITAQQLMGSCPSVQWLYYSISLCRGVILYACLISQKKSVPVHAPRFKYLINVINIYKFLCLLLFFYLWNFQQNAAPSEQPKHKKKVYSHEIKTNFNFLGLKMRHVGRAMWFHRDYGLKSFSCFSFVHVSAAFHKNHVVHCITMCHLVVCSYSWQLNPDIYLSHEEQFFQERGWKSAMNLM